MKIREIALSVFEMESNTSRFDLTEVGAAHRRWMRRDSAAVPGEVHVLHVRTDEGVEGVCTVGDARYTTFAATDLDQLRVLAIGESALDRERLFRKLDAATRTMFAKPGWFGAFDNCLWDIAGKVSGLPACVLMGRARQDCPAYYNIGGVMDEEAADIALRDAERAMSLGFQSLKDHFQGSAKSNIRLFEQVRAAVGDEIVLTHDAALAGYPYADALTVGRALGDLDYLWFEEPLPDRGLTQLRNLAVALDIPILAPESLMHDMALSAEWLIAGAVDHLRANGRHGATAMLKLAHLAELHCANIEFNGPGGLFGLVHAHLVCAVGNTSYYEYFPGGSRDEIGREIGLLNPPLPVDGRIAPPDAPGWGAAWDWPYFERKRVAVL